MPSPPPESRSPLLLQLQADQSDRWQHGERVGLEHYLAHYPEIAGDAGAQLELIQWEMLHRLSLDERPSLDEYLERFPQHGEVLRRYWLVIQMAHPRSGSHDGGADSTGSADPTRLRPSHAAAAPPRLPGFELGEKLGEGGMGVVYKAHDTRLDQVRAVKFIRTGPFAGPEARERFHREARAAARLEHPGVVRIHSLGEHAGVLFLSMDFVPGGSLLARLRDGPLPVREAAELVRQLARAVHHAHENRILHRDLKPANVLLGADGAPRVTDFGLAKLLDGDSDLTHTGALLGTPSYMAPEQAEGRPADVGERTDVWALGVILYECLTGRPPFAADSRSETLRRVARHAPVSPRCLRPQIEARLEAVCLKCLEKDPRHRYPSAAALADDLGAWLGGQATVARPLTPAAACWRFIRSHPRAAVTLTLLAPLTLALALAARPPDPDRARREADATLAAGIPYEFDGAGRLPGPLRWVIGDPLGLKPDPADGCFSCRTLGTALLEVVADPKHDRYLFSAQMRHDDGPENSHLGLYFGLRDHHTAEGRRQSGYFTVSFADLGLLAETQPGPDGRAISQVRFRASLFEKQSNNEWTPGNSIGRPLLFRPALALGRQGPWRGVAVKVTPEGVEAFWCNDAGTLERFEKVSAARLEEGLTAVRNLHAGFAGVPSTFHPRASLGLILYRGSASFRNIRIEPLPGGVD